MNRLEVQLFGFPSLRLDGCSVDLALRKGLGLVAHLADARVQVGRDHMAGLLWPEADVEAARSRLRRTLHKVRAAFTVDVIEADRTSLALAPSIEVRTDAHAFEAACAAGELNEALRLYSGDFLQGLSIDGCAAFEEWAFFRREALRSRLVQALERLIEREIVAGDARAAIAAATRLAGLDPLNESAQRQLINAHLRAGDQAAAERQYETCARLLESDLGIAPDAQTRALLAVPRVEEHLSGTRTRYAERRGLHIAYQVVGAVGRWISSWCRASCRMSSAFGKSRAAAPSLRHSRGWAASSCSIGAVSACPIAWAHRRRWRQRPRTSRPPWMRPAAGGCC